MNKESWEKEWKDMKFKVPIMDSEIGPTLDFDEMLKREIEWIKENFVPKSQLLKMIDLQIEAGHQSKYIEYAQGYLAALEEIKEKITKL